jgi:ATP-binding cassette subfamily A (ABC1) protein 3
MIEAGDMELPISNKAPDVVLSNLSKKFFKYQAVDNLSLSLFRDEILVLLGHNGAGKTTTINMLIGELKASSGKAVGFGKNLLVDDDSTSNLISVCP